MHGNTKVKLNICYIPLCRKYWTRGPPVDKHWCYMILPKEKLGYEWFKAVLADCRPQICNSVQAAVNIQTFGRKSFTSIVRVKKREIFNVLVLGNTPVLSRPPWGTRYSYMQYGGVVKCIRSDNNTYIWVSDVKLRTSFYVLLTVHLSITSVINQFVAQNLVL